MRLGIPRCFFPVTFAAIALMIPAATLPAPDAHFHNAPTSSKQLKNPYAGQQTAIAAGAKLYGAKCGSCHGSAGEGTGNIPPLAHGPTQVASDGEVFWFITKGSVGDGMPSWASTPEQERWQIVTYLKSLKNSTSAATNDSATSFKPVKTNAPPPQPPFTDFRYEEPGKTRKITVQDLPAPYATDTASNGPQVVARPSGAWPKAPAGFTVQQYATGLHNPRLIRTAPNGDFFSPKAAPAILKCSAELPAMASRNRSTRLPVGSTGHMGSRSILPEIILNGSMSETPTRSSASRIRMGT